MKQFSFTSTNVCDQSPPEYMNHIWSYDVMEDKLTKGWQVMILNVRNELLNGEISLPLDEVKYVIDRWRMDYDHYRPHSSLSYMIPVAFVQLCREVVCMRRYTQMPDEDEVKHSQIHWTNKWGQSNL